MCKCVDIAGFLSPFGGCSMFLNCTKELARDKTEPKPDTEALFKKFIDEFPVLSALDVFCNPCARPRAISYREDPEGGPEFFAVFSCNCEAFGIGYRSGRPPMTREEVMKLIQGVNSRE